jgi:hypothetical protein
LSATDTVPVRVPVAVGVKVTEIVQLAPGPMLVPQVFVWAKSLEFVPVILMPLMVIEAEGRVFLIVMVCGALVVPTD